MRRSRTTRHETLDKAVLFSFSVTVPDEFTATTSNVEQDLDGNSLWMEI
jgi:hypothetical protein